MPGKVKLLNDSDLLRVESGGSIDIASGAKITLAGTLSAALTAALTTITPADAAGTPDYAIAAVTNSSPFGFSNAPEAITLLYVIKNLQTRLGELESRLSALGILP